MIGKVYKLAQDGPVRQIVLGKLATNWPDFHVGVVNLQNTNGDRNKPLNIENRTKQKMFQTTRPKIRVRTCRKGQIPSGEIRRIFNRTKLQLGHLLGVSSVHKCQLSIQITK